MTAADQKDLKDLLKSLPDKGVTRLAGIFMWASKQDSQPIASAMGFENLYDLSTAITIAKGEMGTRKLSEATLPDEVTKVESLYQQIVKDLKAKKPDFTPDDYITDLMYVALNTRAPDLLVDPISKPPAQIPADDGQTPSFGAKYGKTIFVSLTSVTGAALFGAVISPFVSKKISEKHFKKINIGMYVIGLAAGILIGIKVWDKQLAKNINAQLKAGN